ncbi:MAG: histidine kinase [Gemmatimonadota bacterium]|nr:histidine kinase [Gemmatimonadota bacterium]
MNVSAQSLPIPDAASAADDVASAALTARGRTALLDAARRAPWRWALYDLLAWTGMAVLFAAQEAIRSPRPFGHLFASNFASFLICVLFTPIIAWVTLRYRFSDNPTKAVIAQGITLVVFLTIGSAMMGAVEWMEPYALPAMFRKGIIASMNRAVESYIAYDTLFYILIATTATTLAYGRESRERAVRAAKLQAQLAEAQLHALSAQLHPHFLFNTLHAISALVRPDPKRAEQLIARLSELLRQMLDAGDRVEITLEEELSFLEKYVDIQEARFGPRLQVRFSVAPNALGVHVPRLVLQPLVENAIRHGIAKRSGPGRVEVSAECVAGRLTLIVRDDGIGVPNGGPERQGVGLSSTRARLAQLYGDEHQFTIAPLAEGGTLCTIRIPCRHADAKSA